MATGGVSYSKKESKQRSNWKRTTSYSDRDDALSLNSVPNDVRINNWDFSDWRPNSQSVDVKRRKKSKGNPEREREQSLSLDSPPQTEKKQRTPSTFPRTKITPSTPTSQRVALENLRQHMTFSDFEEQGSTDGEPNNERIVTMQRRRLPNYTRQDTSSAVESQQQTGDNRREVRSNRNNNRDEAGRESGPDSNQIVGRLMQIRDYIKQANSMLDNLQKAGDPQSCKEDLEKLKKLIENLKEQERGYMGLLQQTLVTRVDSNYSKALRGESIVENDADIDGRREEPTKQDSDDTVSVDLEVQTNASETTEENTHSSSSRPRIEDKLGIDSEDEGSEDSNSSRGSETMDNTVIPNRTARLEREFDTSLQENEEAVASAERNVDLEHLKRQEELLKILLDKQAQLQQLQERQEALMAMKDDCEKRLVTAQMKEKAVESKSKSLAELEAELQATASALKVQPLKSNIVGYPESEDEENNPEVMPKELMELRRHLKVLKNELKNETTSYNNTESEITTLTVGRQQLQYKLEDLQDKKNKMDDLLCELQNLRSHRLDLLVNNEPEPSSAAAVVTSSQTRISDSLSAVAGAEQTAQSAQNVLEMMDAQSKLKKLQEVREHLNQLRDLVQYYQTSKDSQGEGADQEEQASVPGYSDFRERDAEAALQQLLQQVGQEGPPRRQVHPQESRPFTSLPQMVNLPTQSQEHSDEENASETGSNDESQLSSLGPWGDDPEIQEKVRKLRAAKEKLRQLQDLVAMVKQSPDVVRDLPENITELAASIEEENTSQMTQTNDQNVSVSEGEVPVQDKEGGACGNVTIQSQQDELEQLRGERQRLLAIHSTLKTLHDQFGNDPGESDERNDSDTKATRGSEQQQPNTNTPVVTFASNDELYSKMRKQRILREELRQKKKELEALMRKDNNKKQYFRNQDNQSDTVSYSTDAFAASADATMATWGGSTVDNLGSITEDEDGNDQEAEEDDDGYPSDGIVQVEEEEEENDTDNGTYTIENDARQRRSGRTLLNASQGARPKTSRGRNSGFPRPLKKQDDSTRPKQIVRAQKKKGKRGKQSIRTKQENYRSAEEIVREAEHATGGQPLGAFHQQLERTSQMCQALLLDQQNLSQAASSMSPTGYSIPLASPYRPAMMPDMLQHQLQQQQLMLALNQCYQQLSMQQMEMQGLQQQLQGLTLQISDTHQQPRINDTCDEQQRSPSQTSRLTPMTTSFSAIPNSASASFNLQTSRQASFTLNPHFPSTFPYTSGARRPDNKVPHPVPPGPVPVEESKRGGPPAESTLSCRDTDDVNNLRPVPPPRVDSYLHSVEEREMRSQLNNKTSSEARHPNILSLSHPDRNVDGSCTEKSPRLNLKEVISSRKRKSTHRDPSPISQSSIFQNTVSGVQRYSTPSCTVPDVSTARSSSSYRPGLSAGISGAGFHDNTRLSSALSARLLSCTEGTQTKNRDTNAFAELSLFEALRETIYSEVATLISQNESRPHFLIELFRILQHLTTDYLRQRGLYAMQDLVTKTLMDESDSFAAPLPPWLNTAENCTASELTPSESLATSDEEEVKTRLREHVASNERKKRQTLQKSGSLNNDAFDYVEAAENTSSLSTPGSNSHWDSPFAQDSLGDTVIHFDKALEKMRAYEKQKNTVDGEKEKEVSEGLHSRLREVMQSASEPTSSSAVDQGSESSISDIPYPRIDTQQLDQQIKSIMTEVIPVIKEHMDDVCSPQLLAYIKRLVLSLTRQHDNGQEFARFFHRQLASILQDSMAKFEGKKMRECGEEILVDMSEVLFNELAFFRLMKDLDEPAVTEKIKTKSWFKSVSDRPLPNGKTVAALVGEQSEGSSESSSELIDDDYMPTPLRMTATEEEDLGKERDDELAGEMPVQDAEDKDDDPELPYKLSGLQIELAVSETKPFTRIGSDEDEDEADESRSMEDPSETAVSRSAKMEHASPHEAVSEPTWEENCTDESQPTDIKQEKSEGDGVQQERLEADGVKQERSEADGIKQEKLEADGTVEESVTDNDTSGKVEENQVVNQVNGEQMNGEVEEEVTVDDLPTSLGLANMHQVEKKMEEEERATTGREAILSTMDVEVELAGDGNALKEPGSST